MLRPYRGGLCKHPERQKPILDLDCQLRYNYTTGHNSLETIGEQALLSSDSSLLAKHAVILYSERSVAILSFRKGISTNSCSCILTQSMSMTVAQ